jgi:hypothetical protein
LGTIIPLVATLAIPEQFSIIARQMVAELRLVQDLALLTPVHLQQEMVIMQEAD